MSRIPSANHLPQPGRRKCITLQLVSREQGSWNGQLAIKQCPRQGRRKGGKPPATARLRTPACLTGTSLTPAAHQAPSASAPARTREVWQQGWQPSCPLDPFPLRRGRRNSQQDCDSSGVLQDFSVILRWCAYDRHTRLGDRYTRLGDRHTCQGTESAPRTARSGKSVMGAETQNTVPDQMVMGAAMGAATGPSPRDPNTTPLRDGIVLAAHHRAILLVRLAAGIVWVRDRKQCSVGRRDNRYLGDHWG